MLSRRKRWLTGIALNTVTTVPLTSLVAPVIPDVFLCRRAAPCSSRGTAAWCQVAPRGPWKTRRPGRVGRCSAAVRPSVCHSGTSRSFRCRTWTTLTLPRAAQRRGLRHPSVSTLRPVVLLPPAAKSRGPTPVRLADDTQTVKSYHDCMKKRKFSCESLHLIIHVPWTSLLGC